MKQRKIFKHVSFFLMFVLIMGSMNILPVSAGTSYIVVDNRSFDEELDTSLWNNMEGDIQIQNKTLIFPNESSSETSLITRTDARNSGVFEDLVKAEVNMQFTQLPADKMFVMAFGLASVEAMLGEPGNVEIGFVNNGGLKVFVTAYGEDGNGIVLVDRTACGSLNGNVKINVKISAEGTLSLTVRGKKICNKQLPCSGEGRVGFLQTGSCGVKISDLHIESYKYDAPENCNVFEDFEKETINSNTLTARVVEASPEYAPSRMLIREYDGNRALFFENAATTYIGTQYKYSNFEMTFDVVYLQRENEEDEAGNILVPRSDTFAVSFGDEAADYDTYGYVTSADVIAFLPGSRAYSLNTEEIGYATDKGYPFYDAECTKDFTVNVSVIDAVVTVGIKWAEEETFTEFFTYELSGKTPLGYVHIWTIGLNANFAIDNLSIVNKDKDPKLIDVEYKSALIEKPADFEYEPMEVKYMPQKEKQSEFNFYWIIPMVAGICVAAVATNLLVKKVKRRKEEGVANEKA